MIVFLKTLYKLKIKLMFFFNLGFSEFATPIAVVRDIAIVLTFLKLVLGVGFSLAANILICLVSGGIFILIGWVLKESGLSDFATKIGNNINPDLKLIRKIATKLKVDNDI